MAEWRKWGRRLLYPPLWVVLLLCFFGAVALVAVFVNGWERSVPAYVVYAGSFYALTVLCLRCVKTAPAFYRGAKGKVYGNRFGNRYMTDTAFRTHVSLYVSFGINLLYVGLNLLSGWLYQTRWFLVLAGYYTVLAVMRFLLLRYFRHYEIGDSLQSELKRARVCAYVLLGLNPVLTAAVLMMLFQNRGYEYGGVLIYVMAAYTFYVTVQSIVDVVRHRKGHSPVIVTAKLIRLAAALVSMLALETAMLLQFGQDSTPAFRYTMIATTGGAIALCLTALSVYMIVYTGKKIKQLRAENDAEKQGDTL